MSDMVIRYDEEACMAGWGPCGESYNFSHTCKKQRGHDGFHVCGACGNRQKLARIKDDQSWRQYQGHVSPMPPSTAEDK